MVKPRYNAYRVWSYRFHGWTWDDIGNRMRISDMDAVDLFHQWREWAKYNQAEASKLCESGEGLRWLLR